MIAYLVLLAALLSRLLPPLLHVTALNFTAVGGSLLYFGARRPRWQSAVAVLALMVTDYLLTAYAYHYPFHVGGYLVTWAWYAGVCLLGHQLLQRTTALRVTAGVLTSATSFFLLSNFMVWTGHMYAHSMSGLVTCYVRALPFYRNDLISTALVAGVLFGLPALAARTAEPAPSRDALTLEQ
jgi:hypothetical protein